MNLDLALYDPFIVKLRASLSAHVPARHENLPGARMAAVALILRMAHAELPEMLLIKRAEYETDPWSGHVALPGGRQEPGDAGLSDTAVREVFEELALDLGSSGVLIGSLDDVTPRTPRLPPIIIRPFVAVVGSSATLVPSAEVAAAFWIPLARLRDPSVYIRTVVSARGEDLSVDGYQIGEHFVWGLTERILRRFFDLIE